ncbi:MAG: chemotaxis response regulator protein-glutamate methylesterase [Planctomycetota bacterium]
MPIRVLVVDDSAFMRRALSEIIKAAPGLELVGTAFNGRNGLDKIERLSPDVVTLDVEMPELDGLSALKLLMKSHPSPPAVLMCSSLTKQGSRVALDALTHGAADVIAKPATAIGLHESPDGRLLIEKIRAIARSHRVPARPAPTETRRSDPARPSKPDAGARVRHRSFAVDHPLSCVVVGSSTGGPPALERMLQQLPAGISVPIVIAQHMPKLFTQSMAERLAGMTALNVVHAETGMPLLPGSVYVGQGGQHVRLGRVTKTRTRIEITSEPARELYKPSVNVLFESAARIYGKHLMGVMLTGMGDDGLNGSRALVEAGGVLIGQDEASSVVYGMPRAVAEAGLVRTQMDPETVGRTIARLTDADRVTPAA